LLEQVLLPACPRENRAMDTPLRAVYRPIPNFGKISVKKIQFRGSRNYRPTFTTKSRDTILTCRHQLDCRCRVHALSPSISTHTSDSGR